MTLSRLQPGTANDCDITPLSFWTVWVLLTFVLPKLLLNLGVIS